MKKYYDLYEEKLCVILNWNKGYGSIEDAKSHFKTDKVKEISSEEFNRLLKVYGR